MCSNIFNNKGPMFQPLVGQLTETRLPSGALITKASCILAWGTTKASGRLFPVAYKCVDCYWWPFSADITRSTFLTSVWTKISGAQTTVVTPVSSAPHWISTVQAVPCSYGELKICDIVVVETSGPCQVSSLTLFERKMRVKFHETHNPLKACNSDLLPFLWAAIEFLTIIRN